MRAKRGRWAEELALRHLNEQGLRSHSTNFRWRGGEIDLIMLQGETVVFVEVRYRSRFDFGDGAESITWRKRGRIVNTAHYFLQQHPGLRNRPCRFDVVAITGRDPEPAVEWIPNAFEGSR